MVVRGAAVTRRLDHSLTMYSIASCERSRFCARFFGISSILNASIPGTNFTCVATQHSSASTAYTLDTAAGSGGRVSAVAVSRDARFRSAGVPYAFAIASIDVSPAAPPGVAGGVFDFSSAERP